MTLRIHELDLVAGARAARGLAVIIDVFRAFSVAPYAYSRGVARIIPVDDLARARQLQAAHPDFLLMGERHARKLPGFDFGNSPAEIEAADIAGRTLIHTTHAGTQGLCGATGADEVVTGSLVNAAAIVRYIRARQPDEVSLVRMGHEARRRCDEDDLCAELLRARLEGRDFDTSSIRERLRAAPAAAKFFDPAADWAPERDFELCTDVDRFDFVLKLQDREGSLPWLARIAA